MAIGAKNILVTGGAGLIGTALVERLVRDGHEITTFDAEMYGREPLIRLDQALRSDHDVIWALSESVRGRFAGGSNETYQFSEFHHVRGSTLDQEVLSKLFRERRFDMVVHLGEIIGLDACNENPEKTRQNNFFGPIHIINLAVRAGIPLLINSSSSLYGDAGLHLPEHAPLRYKPNDHYCLNKHAVEQYIDKIAPEAPYALLRLATVTGISYRTRLDLLPMMIATALKLKNEFTISHSSQSRALVDIRDVTNIDERA